jgi:hypothetical protein
LNVVVNHLYFASAVPDTALLALEYEALPACRLIPGFVSAQLVKVDAEHHMMVVIGETPETLEAVSGGAGGAWVAEHLRPLLTQPPERYVGEVLTSRTT